MSHPPCFPPVTFLGLSLSRVFDGVSVASRVRREVDTFVSTDPVQWMARTKELSLVNVTEEHKHHAKMKVL